MTDRDSPWRPELPHNQLPALPPARELECRAVLKACIEARAALAELKQAAELIPNQAKLINTIPLLEAKDSSEIGNIVTTTASSSNTPKAPRRAKTTLIRPPRRHCATALPCSAASSHCKTGRCAPRPPWMCAAP